MNTDSFTRYLRNPSLLYQISYQELKSLALQYPYCQNLHWLLLQKSYMDALPDWEQNLHRAAAYSIDRNFLYRQMKQINAKVPESDNFLLEEEYLELKSLSELEEDDGGALLKAEGSAAEHSPIGQSLSRPLGGEEPYRSPEGGLEFHLHEEEEPIEDEETLEEPEAEAGLAPPEGEKESTLTDQEEPAEEAEEVEEAAESSTDNQSISQAVQVDQPIPAFQADEGLLQALAAIDAILFRIQQHSPAPIPPPEVEPSKKIHRPLISPELAALKNQPYSRTVHPKPSLEPPPPPRPQPKQSFTSWIEQFQSPHIQGQLGELMESRKREEKKKKKKLKKKNGDAPGGEVSLIAIRSITENQEIASETLAELLASQGLADKAREMYQRLILVFPEKSDYFASKIENLKSE